MEPLLATSPGRWFAGPSAADTPLGRALLRDLSEADPVGYAACCDAIEHARELADGIPRARLETVAAGQLAVEQSHAVRDALSTLLNNS